MKKDTFYRNILDRITSGVYFVNQDRVITYWNKGAEQISGYSAKEVVGKPCSKFLNHIDETGKILCGDGCPLLGTMADGVSRQAEVLMLHKMGTRVPVMVQAISMEPENGETPGAVEIFSDISFIKRAEARIRELADIANMDALTGIYNRRGLEFILGECFDDFQRYQTAFGVVFIDVDDFKEINDQYGHTVGDQVLIGISNTLKQCLRDSDSIGRWGGDEFVVLLQDVSENTIQNVVKKIESVVNGQSYKTDTDNFFVNCSCGGVIPSDTEALTSLMSRADMAMYQVKKDKYSKIHLAP